MRLDHLLSKEHHEKRPATSWGVSREGVGRCSGVHRVRNNNFFCFRRGKAAGTLLGPETTPGPLVGGGVVAPLGGGVWWLICG